MTEATMEIVSSPDAEAQWAYEKTRLAEATPPFITVIRRENATAMQWTGKNYEALMDWLGGERIQPRSWGNYIYIYCGFKKPYKAVPANVGDWITKECDHVGVWSDEQFRKCFLQLSPDDCLPTPP